MSIFDNRFFESNFCNVSRIDREEFPKTIGLIHESYKSHLNPSKPTNVKNKPTIKTAANKTACRISR